VSWKTQEGVLRSTLLEAARNSSNGKETGCASCGQQQAKREARARYDAVSRRAAVRGGLVGTELLAVPSLC